MPTYRIASRPSYLPDRTFWDTTLPDGTVVRSMDRAVFEAALEAVKRVAHTPQTKGRLRD